MKNAKDHPRQQSIDEEELQRDISRFEKMSEDDLDQYLTMMNVDATKTVASVLEIVRSNTKTWNRRPQK